MPERWRIELTEGQDGLWSADLYLGSQWVMSTVADGAVEALQRMLSRWPWAKWL